MAAHIIDTDASTILDRLHDDVGNGTPVEAALAEAYQAGLGRGAQRMAETLTVQHDWDLATFGPGLRTKPFLDHLLSELVEIEALPSDLEEWIDLAILAFGGAMRHGATPAQVIAQYVAKLAKNRARHWADWRTVAPAQVIEHTRG